MADASFPTSSSPASAPSRRSASAPARCTSAGPPARAASATARRRARTSSRPTTSRARRRAAPTASASSAPSPPTRRCAMPAGTTSCRTTRDRVGCILGTGIGGIETLEDNHDTLRDSGPREVSPLAIPLMMSNAGLGRAVAAPRPARPGLQRRLGLRRGQPRDRHGAARDPVRRRAGRRHRRLGGRADAAVARVVRLDGRAVADRHLAPVRRAPRRLRHGRGRRGRRARGRRVRARARRRDPRHRARLRHDRRRLSPHRAADATATAARARSRSRWTTPA